MATVARGCYWRETKLWNEKKKKRKREREHNQCAVDLWEQLGWIIQAPSYLHDENICPLTTRQLFKVSTSQNKHLLQEFHCLAVSTQLLSGSFCCQRSVPSRYTPVQWPGCSSLSDPDTLIWINLGCCYTIKSTAKIRRIPDEFNPCLEL